MPLVDRHIPVPGHDYRGGIVDAIGDRFDSGLKRPFFDGRGRPCVVVNTGRWTTERGERVPLREKRRISDLSNRGWNADPTWNATSLRKEDWIELDRTVLRAARQRMRAWEDLKSANSYGGFNGMAKMTLEYEAMSDPGEAVVDMDVLSSARGDTPLFSLRALPLPVTHSDFWYSKRRLDVSRNSDTPLDTTMGEAAGRRIGEMVEKTTIGTETGVTFGTVTTGPTQHTGTSTVYGYTNFPQRLTKTNFTAPTAGGWVPDTTHNEILAALDQLYAQFFYGPFMVYHSIDWTQYINRVYAVSGGNNPGETLRTMLLKNPDIIDVRRLDFLTSTFTLLLVQMTADVARAVNGMDVTTVQWEGLGGLRLNFKVLAIQVPQLRYDYNGRAGILHGTTS